MERPAKRQKLSLDLGSSIPTRTLDSTSFHRRQNRHRDLARLVLPRTPDVTVTAGILEVTVNGGSITTQIAVPTTEVTVSIGSLGTLTVPVLSNSTSTGGSSSSSSIAATASGLSSTSLSSSSSTGSSQSQSQSSPSLSASSSLSQSSLASQSQSSSSSASQSLSQSSLESQSQSLSQSQTQTQSSSQSRSQSQTSTETQSPPKSQSQSQSQAQTPSSNDTQSASLSVSNSTLVSTTQHTVTVTATSTFQVSYNNGTFIIPTGTSELSSTDSVSGSGSGSSSSSKTDTSRESTTNSRSSTALSVSSHGVTDRSTEGFTTTSAVYSSNNGGITAAATAAAAATATQSVSDPTSSSASNDNSSSAPVLTPAQTQMVGGVVGGVAGVALVLVVILYVLRWYRQRLKQTGRLPQRLNSRHSREFNDPGLIGSAAPMSQNSRMPFFQPAAVVGSSMKKWRPSSDMTLLTNTTSATDSEKGFHRVSGRKIPSVLSTGGDQFGGSYGAFEREVGSVRRPLPFSTRHHHDLSETSFYRDANGMYIQDSRPGSRSTPSTPVYPNIFTQEKGRRPSWINTTAIDRRDFANDIQSAFGQNQSTADGVAVFRSSPARTPVTASPSTSSIRLPIQAPVTMDDDIPEMPLPSPGMYNYGYGLGLGHNVASHGVPGWSSGGSAKFKEEWS